MKKQHLLSICIVGALLTACGGGSDGNNTGINKGHNNSSATDNNSNSNGSNSNGSNSNGSNSNGSNSNGSNSNGSNGNGSNSNGSNSNGSDGNGSSSNGSNTNNGTNNSNQTSSNGKLPYEHEVPEELKEAVEEALTLELGSGNYSITIGNKSYNGGDDLKLTDFDLGLTKTNYNEGDDSGSSKGSLKIYRQNYSALMTFLPTDRSINDEEEHTDTRSVTSLRGYVTETMPETGKATYKGKSFYQQEEGDFNLDVNFGENTVKGEITGLSVGTVNLAETSYETSPRGSSYTGSATLPSNSKFTVEMATITKNGMKNVHNKDFTADKYNFSYYGIFFGPKAEETVGSLWAVDKTGEDDYAELIDFAGQRGEIKK